MKIILRRNIYAKFMLSAILFPFPHTFLSLESEGNGNYYFQQAFSRFARRDSERFNIHCSMKAWPERTRCLEIDHLSTHWSKQADMHSRREHSPERQKETLIKQSEYEAHERCECGMKKCKIIFQHFTSHASWASELHLIHKRWCRSFALFSRKKVLDSSSRASARIHVVSIGCIIYVVLSRSFFMFASKKYVSRQKRRRKITK